MTELGLTAAELASIRSDVNQLMPDTCTIEQVTETQDAIGSPARSFSNRATGVACRLDAFSSITSVGKDFISSMKNYLIQEGQYILTLPYDTTVIESDRIVINGSTYEIAHIDEDKSWIVSKRLVLEKVEN